MADWKRAGKYYEMWQGYTVACVVDGYGGHSFTACKGSYQNRNIQYVGDFLHDTAEAARKACEGHAGLA